MCLFMVQARAASRTAAARRRSADVQSRATAKVRQVRSYVTLLLLLMLLARPASMTAAARRGCAVVRAAVSRRSHREQRRERRHRFTCSRLTRLLPCQVFACTNIDNKF